MYIRKIYGDLWTYFYADLMRTDLLKILQINSLDGGGGAFLVAYHLMEKLEKRGISSPLYVGFMKSSSNSRVKYISKRIEIANKIIAQVPLPKKYRDMFGSALRAIVKPISILQIITGKEYANVYSTKRELKRILKKEKPNIVHCHNLHIFDNKYFDLSVLPWLSKQVPTIITLHDAWFFTGHCVHYFDCMEWKKGCSDCQNISTYPRILQDATAYNWQKRKQIYADSKLYVVGPSRWVVDSANESILKEGIIKSLVIPNGVDLSIFHPGDKVSAREKLSLPKDVFIIVFSASGLKKNIYKDYLTLRNTLKILEKNNEKILCLALGDSGDTEFIGSSIELRFIPFISNPHVIAEYYRAADIYVHPAKAETFGLVIVEAEACGLPVIASDVCGIPETIVDGKTGYLVPVGDADMLVSRILLLKKDNKKRAEMGVCAAELAKERYDDKVMVNRYLSLYQEVCERQLYT